MRLTPEQRDLLHAYLLADRQWKRKQRIAYARLCRKFAEASTGKIADPRLNVAFWDAVIAFNSH